MEIFAMCVKLSSAYNEQILHSRRNTSGQQQKKVLTSTASKEMGSKITHSFPSIINLSKSVPICSQGSQSVKHIYPLAYCKVSILSNHLRCTQSYRSMSINTHKGKTLEIWTPSLQKKKVRHILVYLLDKTL